MRPSLRTIANLAGVSVSTVSLALRGLAKVDPETRDRIAETAKGLGYIRDPQLSQALAFARKKEKSVYRETLAFLMDWPLSRLSEMSWLQEMKDGAAARAAALGYGMECIVYPPADRPSRTLTRQLHARGIRGLLLTPGMSRVPFTVDIDFSRFAAVEIGQTLQPSLPSRIVRDVTGDYLFMLEELKLRGYRRVGLAITDKEEIRHQWSILAAYLAFHHRHRRMTPITATPAAYKPDALIRWIKREKPDAIVVNGQEMCDWVRAAGWSTPQDIGLCRIDALNGPDSGLRPDYAGMGHAAVDSLAASLERGEIGPSKKNTLLCIQNAWLEGSTLNPRPANAPPPALPPRPIDRKISILKTNTK